MTNPDDAFNDTELRDLLRHIMTAIHGAPLPPSVEDRIRTTIATRRASA